MREVLLLRSTVMTRSTSSEPASRGATQSSSSMSMRACGSGCLRRLFILDGGLLDDQRRDAVFDRVDAATFETLDCAPILFRLHPAPARGADDVERFDE